MQDRAQHQGLPKGTDTALCRLQAWTAPLCLWSSMLLKALLLLAPKLDPLNEGQE